MEISEFQRLMQELYVHNDRRRGGKATMLWLVEEVGELAEAIRREEPDFRSLIHSGFISSSFILSRVFHTSTVYSRY